jgi:predicted lipoprotein with Yx(FWY)xxD motif
MAVLAALAVVGLIAAACGSSTPSAGHSTTTTPVSPAATTGAGQVVADVMSSAKIGSPILTNSAGMTLYKFSADSGTTSACAGSCATAWPPVTVPSGTVPKGGPGASGSFGTITRSDGTLQVTFDGHPLYTFSGDSSAGATNGQNLTSDGGTWTVVTVGTATSPPPTNASATTTTNAPSPTTTKPSGGGYGY